MSYIPNDVMPHATVQTDEEQKAHRSIFQWLSDTARENPRQAIGAGAALLVGAIAAAAIPFIRTEERKPRKRTRKTAAARTAKPPKAKTGPSRARKSATPKSEASRRARKVDARPAGTPAS